MSRKQVNKNNSNKSALSPFVIILCIIGVLFLFPLFSKDNFYESFQNNLDPFKEIFKKATDNVTNYNGVDIEAKNLANLAKNGDKFMLYVIDTGNSDCILLRTPKGNTVLIDSGESDDFDNIRDTLYAFGIKKLDNIIATHPDADHIGSMGELIIEFNPAVFYMPYCVPTDKNGEENPTITYQRMMDSLSAQNIEPTIVQQPFSFEMDGAKFDILQPMKKYRNTNDNSIVLLASYGKNKMLFIGDAEKEAIDDLTKDYGDKIDVDILKVGHHGSSTSTVNNELLNKATPQYGIINCGKDNAYDHPHAETLQELNKYNVEILRTDELGDIAMFSDGITTNYYTQYN